LIGRLVLRLRITLVSHTADLFLPEIRFRAFCDWLVVGVFPPIIFHGR
jgi:hypothetical protein